MTTAFRSIVPFRLRSFGGWTGTPEWNETNPADSVSPLKARNHQGIEVTERTGRSKPGHPGPPS
jgi:hypothetical protein